jgi:putative transposase
MPLFFDDADRLTYLALLEEFGHRCGVGWLCWGLMMNHSHLVAVPQTAEALAESMFHVHKKYAEHFNRKRGTVGSVFQHGFHSSVLDEVYLLAVVAYVLRNPERAGIVRTAVEYEWSSARFMLGDVATDRLVSSRKPFDISVDWREMIVREPQRLDTIRRCVRSGCPMGSAEFVRNVLERHGLEGDSLARAYRYVLKQLGIADPTAATLVTAVAPTPIPV